MALTQQGIIDVSYLCPKMLFGPAAGLNFLINELVSTSFHSTKIISSFLLVTFNKIAYHSKNLGSKIYKFERQCFLGGKRNVMFKSYVHYSCYNWAKYLILCSLVAKGKRAILVVT